jgi:hypothetical protein
MIQSTQIFINILIFPNSMGIYPVTTHFVPARANDLSLNINLILGT